MKRRFSWRSERNLSNRLYGRDDRAWTVYCRTCRGEHRLRPESLIDDCPQFELLNSRACELLQQRGRMRVR